MRFGGRLGSQLGSFEAVLTGQVEPDGRGEHSLGSGALALLLWSVNSFLWDAAVSSREAAKKREGGGECV